MKILELIILVATAIVMSSFAGFILFIIGSFITDEIKSRKEIEKLSSISATQYGQIKEKEKEDEEEKTNE